MNLDVLSRGFPRVSPSLGAAFVDDRRDGSSPSTSTPSAIDRAIDRARARATRAERALQEKMSRSMRDLTNRPRVDGESDAREKTFGTRTGGERGSKAKTPRARGAGGEGDGRTVRDGREILRGAREETRARGEGGRTSSRTWIDDVVVSEADSCAIPADQVDEAVEYGLRTTVDRRAAG